MGTNIEFLINSRFENMKIKKQNVLVIVISTVFSVGVYWLLWHVTPGPFCKMSDTFCELGFLLVAAFINTPISIIALITCVIYLSKKLLESPSVFLILMNIIITFILSYLSITVPQEIKRWYRGHDPNIIDKVAVGEIADPSECSKVWDEMEKSRCLISIARNKKSCAFIEDALLKNECENKLYEESEVIPQRYTDILYCEENEDCKTVSVGCESQKIVNKYRYKSEKERSYEIWPMEERVKCYGQVRQVECNSSRNKCVFQKTGDPR